MIRVVTSAFGSGADWEPEFFAEMIAGWAALLDNLVTHLDRHCNMPGNMPGHTPGNMPGNTPLDNPRSDEDRQRPDGPHRLIAGVETR